MKYMLICNEITCSWSWCCEGNGLEPYTLILTCPTCCLWLVYPASGSTKLDNLKDVISVAVCLYYHGSAARNEIASHELTGTSHRGFAVSHP